MATCSFLDERRMENNEELDIVYRNTSEAASRPLFQLYPSFSMICLFQRMDYTTERENR
jgi:hypothetical protein